MLMARQLYIHNGHEPLPKTFRRVLHMFVPNNLLRQNDEPSLLRLDRLTLEAYRKVCVILFVTRTVIIYQTTDCFLSLGI